MHPGQLSNSIVVLFSRDDPKVAHALKTATHKKRPTITQRKIILGN